MDVKFYLIFNFITYSFIGWIIEEIYSFITTKKFKREGFLIGPFKPMYGLAFTSIIICREFLEINGVALVLLCFLIPTTVEYISGYMLKHIFNKVYWNYSDFKYNLFGYITVSFSLGWMFLSFIGINFIQPILYNFYILEEKIIIIGVCIFLSTLILDFVLTLKSFKETALKNSIKK